MHCEVTSVAAAKQHTARHVPYIKALTPDELSDIANEDEITTCISKARLICLPTDRGTGKSMGRMQSCRG